MVEAASISILSKAVDFLFDEGRKILQERRERMQAQAAPSSQTDGAITHEAPKQSAIHKASEELRTKQETLRQDVSLRSWDMYQAQVKHLVALMETYSKNYFLAKQAYAKWGSELVPAIVMHRLDEAEVNVSETMEELHQILEKVYGKSIAIPELEVGGKP